MNAPDLTTVSTEALRAELRRRNASQRVPGREYEQRVMTTLRAWPNGLSTRRLLDYTPGRAGHLRSAVNRLLAADQITATPAPWGATIYRVKPLS